MTKTREELLADLATAEAEAVTARQKRAAVDSILCAARGSGRPLSDKEAEDAEESMSAVKLAERKISRLREALSR